MMEWKWTKGDNYERSKRIIKDKKGFIFEKQKKNFKH
jgi:hypothetical protein